MTHLGLLAAVLAMGAPMAVSAPARAAEEALKLTVGEARTLEVGPLISSIVIDTPEVVGARMPSNHEVELTGLKPGAVHLKLVSRGAASERDYAIEVAPTDTAKAANLRDVLRAAPGLEAVDVSYSNGRYLLSGEVKDVESHARLTRLAAGRVGDTFTDTVAVTGAQMVAVDVAFYAIAADTLHELGFNFSSLGGDIQGGIITPNSLQNFSNTAQGLTLTAGPALQAAFNLLLARPKSGALGAISALSNAGLSQVLAQPTLLVRSGEQADFLAGGDVPIPVPQGGGSTGAIGIEYRPYGVRLTVAPVVLSDKRILLKLSPEVSELDYTNQVTIQGSSVPGFRRRSASTSVELGDGQSFVIAGLTYTTSSSNEDKLPGLGDVPVLGALFKTSQSKHERQELIIVATPRLVRPLNHSPLEDAKLGDTDQTLGERLLNRNGAIEQTHNFGLSR